MPKPWYIDGFGAHYLELYAHRNQREAAQAVTLLDRVGLDLRGLRLLDLACGAGRHLDVLRRREALPVGLDLSSDLLTEAAKGGNSPLLVRGDMRRLPLANASFDGVLSMFTSFGYFDADRENWTVLDEVARVLRPEGFYLFDFINRGWVLRHLEPESKRVGPRFRASEKRRLEGDRVLKEVSIHEGEQGPRLLRYEESVRLFSRDEILEAAEPRSLRLLESWGTYSGRSYSESDSPRMIFLFERTSS